MFKSNHRGMRELDILLGKFAQKNCAKMDDEMLSLYNEFLNLSDEYIYDIIMSGEISKTKYKTFIVTKYNT